MVHKKLDSTAGLYKIPQAQRGLFDAVEDGRLLEDELRAKSGRLGRAERFEILFKALGDRVGVKERVVKVLDRVKEDDNAFAVTLDTIAYARRCDASMTPAVSLVGTLGKLDKCVDNGVLPVHQMRELLEAGISFDKAFFSYVGGSYVFNEAGIQAEKNWLAGWDKSPDRWMHIDFPPKENLIEILYDMGQQTIHDWKSNTNVTLESADERVLRAVYVEKLRAQRSEERKMERFLTTNDW